MKTPDHDMPACKSFVPGRISVIIPTYNYAQFLPQCLDSIIRQNMPDIEIIVVDDGSTDNTPEVLTPYRDRIKYIPKEHEGVNSARNTGIKNCTGEFIHFLDADDLVGDNYFISQLKFLKNNPDVSNLYPSSIRRIFLEYIQKESRCASLLS